MRWLRTEGDVVTDEEFDLALARMTPKQRADFTIKMMEDLIIYDTMMLIHGKDFGPRRARYLLGYGPPC